MPRARQRLKDQKPHGADARRRGIGTPVRGKTPFAQLSGRRANGLRTNVLYYAKGCTPVGEPKNNAKHAAWRPAIFGATETRRAAPPKVTGDARGWI